MADFLGIADDLPDQIPEFAKDDIVDLTSGKNNVQDPHPDQKSYGWFPFRKRPERGVMNWLHRHTYRCINFLQNSFYPACDAALEDLDGRVDWLEANTPVMRYGYLNATLRLIRDNSLPTYGWYYPTADSECTPRSGDRRFLDFKLMWTMQGNLFFLSIPEVVCSCNLGVHTDCVLEIVDDIPEIWFSALKDKQKMKILGINPPIGSAPCNGYMTFAKNDWPEVKWFSMRFMVSLSGGTITNEMPDFLMQRSIGTAAGLPAQTIVGYCG